MAKKNSNIEPKEGEVLDFLSTYKRSEKNQPKPQKAFSYIYFSDPVKKALGFEGFPMSNCISISGYSDTGKTTLLLEGVIECQRKKILPVIISTEGKFSFHHAKFMGMDCDYREEVDEETGELIKIWDQGFFLFKDGFENLEEMYKYIISICNDVLDEKKNFPYDVCFFVDSINKLKCEAAMNKIEEDNMDLPMHNAKVHKNYFSGFIEPMVTNSRYKKYKRSITFVSILRLSQGSGSINPTETGGLAFAYDMGVKIYCGGKLEAALKTKSYTINGQTVVLAKETRLRMLKNHFTGINSEGSLLITPHGFINSDDFDKYKKENKESIVEYFKNVLAVHNSENLEIIENEE
jgi:hypothetical protein